MTEVAIVGLGPWGLCALERLVSRATRPGATPALTRIHVFEPGRPGSGIYDRSQPDYLIMNTPCGEHSMHPYPDQSGPSLGTTSLYEWAHARGYRWVGDHCEITASGVALSPHDFLPRRLLAEFLEWCYEMLVSDLPPTVVVVHHATAAVDVRRSGTDRERVVAADGIEYAVDHVVLTVGLTANVLRDVHFSAIDLTDHAQADAELIAPGDQVGIEGMGLVAIDMVTSLTSGRGGTFVRRGGRLRYQASGREPRISLYSRSGVFYCAKSLGNADPTGAFQPVICTDDAIRDLLAGPGAGLTRRQLDFRQEILPMISAEMTVRYFEQAATNVDGAPAASRMKEDLVRAWRDGRFEPACTAVADSYGAFDALAHLFVGTGETFPSSKDYEEWVFATTDQDLREASMPSGTSPVKAAYEVLRALRDTIRAVVEFEGLTLASHLDFQNNIRGRIARMVAGPPAFRSEQLLALMDAGIVQVPFGPSPLVGADGNGDIIIRSRHLAQPHEVRVAWLLNGHRGDSTSHQSASPLLQNLHDAGRIRQMVHTGTAVGSMQLSRDFHPVDAGCRTASRIWVLGALTEGMRYYTAYIPSPKSRVRAFVDAQLCAEEILAVP